MVEPDRLLWWLAIAHAVIGAGCAVWLAFDAAAVLGVHPALKPMKFGLSIAVFLATMAYVVPALGTGLALRQALAWTLAATMALEMAPILIQAVRGAPSHFNTRAPLDAALWRVMFVAILVATVAVLVVAVLATVRPLRDPSGHPLSALVTAAWRVGLWFFTVALFTGFRMGGQSRHSIGGVDGGAGLPLVNWSVEHGDLRVAHFVGLHAMQSLPLVALALVRAPTSNATRWTVLVAVIAVHVAVAGWTLTRALSGRPAW